jgi:hypothetical protein
VGSLSRRLEALEQRRVTRSVHKPMSEEQQKEQWLQNGAWRQIHENHSREEWYARDVIKLLLPRGEFAGMGIEEFRGRLKEWRPPIDERAIERVSARMAYDLEPPAAEMACPPEWREAFEAADELRERFMAVPTEALAEIFVVAHDLREGVLGDGGDGAIEGSAAELECWGITEELALRAVGPDVEEIPDKERMRRLREILVDFITASWVIGSSNISPECSKKGAMDEHISGVEEPVRGDTGRVRAGLRPALSRRRAAAEDLLRRRA